MIKFIKILCLTCVLCAAVCAQTSGDEYKKNEFYGGYSNQQLDEGSYRTANGFEFAYTRNIHRYFGLKGSVSGAYGSNDFSGTFTDPTTNGTYSYRVKTNTSVYNFLGGVQVKNNASKGRFKPFAHALGGVAVTRNKFNTTCTSGSCPGFIFGLDTVTFSDTHFAGALGGGLDIKINNRLDFRAIQVDYNPIFRGGGSWDHNIRFGVGFVIK